MFRALWELILGVSFSDWLTIIAIVIGPILAVQAQKRLESIRDRRSRQIFIFRTLMSTRATPLSKDHVTALNLIDMDFSEKNKKEKPVVRAWRVLLDQFGKFPRNTDYQDQNEYLIALNSCSEKARDNLIDLLSKMSEALGYDFETIHIRNGCYVPSAHAEIENDATILRKGLIQIMAGTIPLNMNVQSMPEQAPNADVLSVFQEMGARQLESLELLKALTDGSKSIKVAMSE